MRSNRLLSVNTTIAEKKYTIQITNDIYEDSYQQFQGNFFKVLFVI